MLSTVCKSNGSAHSIIEAARSGQIANAKTHVIDHVGTSRFYRMRMLDGPR